MPIQVEIVRFVCSIKSAYTSVNNITDMECAKNTRAMGWTHDLVVILDRYTFYSV